MKKITVFLALFLLAGCFDEAKAQELRLQSLRAANKWLEQNKLEGTASCNYASPYYCDVIPKDPRPPIKLLCNIDNTSCRLSE